MIGVGPVSRRDLHRLAENATVSALHLDCDGNPVRLSRKHRVGASLADTVDAAVTDEKPGPPLDLGRAQRLATKAQWIVLWYRDGGCVVPGCHGPAAGAQPTTSHGGTATTGRPTWATSVSAATIITTSSTTRAGPSNDQTGRGASSAPTALRSILPGTPANRRYVAERR